MAIHKNKPTKLISKKDVKPTAVRQYAVAINRLVKWQSVWEGVSYLTS
jgi:hypothetical protein